MSFRHSITLGKYSDNADKQFADMQSRLSEIENSFQIRMNGKTMGGLVASLIGTLAWLATFVACAVFVRNRVDGRMLMVVMTISLGLIVFMLIDDIMDFSYYGKISSYKNAILQLQNRVNIGKSTIKSNHDAFLASREKGWNYILNAASSIPGEASSIESTMTSMESLKKGFISGVKTIFFYATVIAVTVVGGISLFPIGSSIIVQITDKFEITGEFASSDNLMALNVIALSVVGIGEVILSKYVWSKTDCNVTNTTLFIIALGPVAFLGLIAAVTLLVSLVIMIATVVLSLAVIIAFIAIGVSATSGG